jgi:hypothetical protein
MLTRKMFWRSLVIVALACVGHQAMSSDAFGDSREPDDSTVLECKEAVVDAQLRLAVCTARVFMLDAESRTSTSSSRDSAGAASFEDQDSERKRDRRRGRRRTQERRKQLQPADCTDRYADELEEIREEFIWDQGLDAGLCGLQGEGAGFLGSLCRKQGGFDELIVIGFEAVDVVDPPNALLVNSYSEQGFTIETTNLNPNSALSGVLGLDTTFFPNAGIQRVSQSPGVRVALPEDAIDDIVILRADGEEFRFIGGHFSFTNRLTQLTPASITFEGYKDGELVNIFFSEIVEQGAFIPAQMKEGIDTLVIKDGDPNGWTYVDNLMFQH